MESLLYALSMKFLTTDELKEIKEMMTMTVLGQMLMEDGMAKGIKKGMKKGIEKGEFRMMQELVYDGILTIEAAAGRKQMTVEEFRKKLRELRLNESGMEQ